MTTLTLNRRPVSQPSDAIFSETLKAATEKAQQTAAQGPSQAPVPTLLRAWQWLQSKIQARTTAKPLELTGTLALGEKRTIFVVQVSGRKFLVGGTPNNLTMLADLGPVDGSTVVAPVPVLPATVKKDRRRRTTAPALLPETTTPLESASHNMTLPIAAKTVAAPRRPRRKANAPIEEIAVW